MRIPEYRQVQTPRAKWYQQTPGQVAIAGGIIAGIPLILLAFFLFTGAEPQAEFAPEVPNNRALDIEIEYWNSIKDAGNPDAFDAYLARYPNGEFAEIANLKRAELRNPPVVPAPPPPVKRPPLLRAGSIKLNPKDGLEYVRIPPGTFQMGCVPGDSWCDDEEKPRHPVEISKGFWMGRTEVTVRAYKKFVQDTEREMPRAPAATLESGSLLGNPGWKNADHPILNVNWHDAQAYCEWAGGRLPTEAEWEYAARGGKEGLKYSWGNGISPKNANYGGEGTSSVGSYPANGFGLHDMAGNVWEWCSDEWNYHDNSPALDPQGPPLGTAPVLRGGSWIGVPGSWRASYRLRGGGPELWNYLIGFRCVREVSP